MIEAHRKLISLTLYLLAQFSSEEENMWLGMMDHIMHLKYVEANKNINYPF